MEMSTLIGGIAHFADKEVTLTDREKFFIIAGMSQNQEQMDHLLEVAGMPKNVAWLLEGLPFLSKLAMALLKSGAVG